MIAREYTPDELRDMLLGQVALMVDYWSLGKGKDVRNACEGVAFSILNTLDGCTGSGVPAFDLVAMPNPANKQDCIENGENWVGEETRISDMLHERLYSHMRKATT